MTTQNLISVVKVLVSKHAGGPALPQQRALLLIEPWEGPHEPRTVQFRSFLGLVSFMYFLNLIQCFKSEETENQSYKVIKKTEAQKDQLPTQRYQVQVLWKGILVH